MKGRLVTDSRGRYEFRTIKPGPYPNGGNPIARILSPFLGKGAFSPVCPNRSDALGTLRCHRDIRLKRS